MGFRGKNKMAFVTSISMTAEEEAEKQKLALGWSAIARKGIWYLKFEKENGTFESIIANYKEEIAELKRRIAFFTGKQAAEEEKDVHLQKV